MHVFLPLLDPPVPQTISSPVNLRRTQMTDTTDASSAGGDQLVPLCTYCKLSQTDCHARDLKEQREGAQEGHVFHFDGHAIRSSVYSRYRNMQEDEALALRTSEVISTKSDEVRSVSSTGAEKGVKPDQQSLIPVPALQLLGKLYGKGAEKYAKHNWRKGYEWSKSYDAAQRHMQLFWDGEDIDPEMGLPHVTCATFHMMALATFMIEHPEFDDRYQRPQPLEYQPTREEIRELVDREVRARLEGWDQDILQRNMAAVQEQLDNPIRASKNLDRSEAGRQAMLNYPHGGQEVSHSGD